MNIAIGADHRGFPMKEGLIAWLQETGHTVTDEGAVAVEPGDDYPDYAEKVANAVSSDPEHTKGILICASGIGMAIAANKVEKVRAAMIHDVQIAKAARNDDDINVLALGSDFISLEDTKAVVSTFLHTPFSGAERHVNRVGKIIEMEKKNN